MIEAVHEGFLNQKGSTNDVGEEKNNFWTYVSSHQLNEMGGVVRRKPVCKNNDEYFYS